jgi:NAD(P)-dependent dehydrogenase (short-subunit alcohol dehydrogenase family)
MQRTGTNERADLPVAVVVGVGGMGMAVARRLGSRYRLLLTDSNVERLEKRAAILREEGHDTRHIACDITDQSAVTGLASAVSSFGPMRVLAHVAGLSPSMGDWRTILNVNLRGATLVGNALLPLARQGSAAIFVASLAGHMAPPAAEVLAVLDAPLQAEFFDRLEGVVGGPISTTLAYQLSKTALIRMCAQRVAEWGARQARIVSLSPGLIATPMGALEFERQPMKYDLLKRTPLKREGTMLEIADAVEFLASERASFISGVDLLVDGGIAAALRYGRTAVVDR